MSRETIARGALTDSEKSVRPDRDGEGTPCTCMVGSNAHAHSVDSSASRTDIPNKPQNFAVAQACASRTAPHTQFQPQNSFGILKFATRARTSGYSRMEKHCAAVNAAGQVTVRSLELMPN